MNTSLSPTDVGDRENAFPHAPTRLPGSARCKTFPISAAAAKGLRASKPELLTPLARPQGRFVSVVKGHARAVCRPVRRR